MRLSHSAIHVYPRRGRVPALGGARAAVSLHSHSDCSRETLDFVPAFARGIPFVARLFERSIAEYERLYGRPLDFTTIYWRPPLPPADVVMSECLHLERRLDLRPLVSLTDH